MRYLLLIVLVACGSTTTPSAIAPAPPPSPAAQLEKGLLPAVRVRGEPAQTTTLEARMRELKIPAISIAVFDNYQVVWAKAYGLADVDSGTRADEHTTFLAGSISKSVNGLGQLEAVKDGLLSLDTPINDSLTSWKLPDNELTKAKPVTLRMLLSHTAGTTVHGFGGYAPGDPLPTVPQILDGAPPANSPPVRVDLAPGTQFRYSGGGITISQLALTERAKQPYAQFLEQRVLRPIGMTDSSFDQTLAAERLQHAAVGYDVAGTVIKGKRYAYPEMAAAGLWTTPTDLARFFIEVAKARAGKSTVISKEIAELMTTKVADVPRLGAVGLGVFLFDRNGATYFGHNGADTGFQADALASMDGGRGIVIMANSENGLRLMPEVERTVFALLGWPGAESPIVRVAIDATQRKKFVGRYSIGARPFEIIERDNKLFIHVPFEKLDELVPTAADTVVNTHDGTRLQPTTDGLVMSFHAEPFPPVVRGNNDDPLFLLEAGKFEAAVAALKAVKDARAIEDYINITGYFMIDRDPANATQLLRLNAVAFPDSANAHDSYGEALARTYKTPEAIKEYELVLATVDADPRISPEDKPVFKKRAQEELAKLRSR